MRPHCERVAVTERMLRQVHALRLWPPWDYHVIVCVSCDAWTSTDIFQTTGRTLQRPSHQVAADGMLTWVFNL